MAEQPRDPILVEDGDTYRVRLQGFEGPLDLLLHLIRKNRYDIYDIPIAAILAEYLGVLEVMRELDLDVAGEFLVMAATLAEIKSRLLLPTPLELDEEEGVDPRAELVRRLLEYERLRHAVQQLEERPRLGREVFARNWRAAELDEIETPEAEVVVDFFQFILAFKEIMDVAPEELVHEVERQTFSIQEAIQEILEHFQGVSPERGLPFRDLFPPRPERAKVIATFLALLELIRLRALRAVQASPFGEIRIYPVPEES
jgi:segregation and condensation protein A